MKLGVSAFAWTAKFDRLISGWFRWSRAWDSAASKSPCSTLRISREGDSPRVEANELECTVCAILPTGINPISPDTATRRKSVQHLIRCIETSAALGASLLGGPLYAPIGYLPEHRPSHDEWSWLSRHFSQSATR